MRKHVLTALARDGALFWGYENEATKAKLLELKNFLIRNDGKILTVQLEEHFEKKYRSLKQNNYYWGVVVKIFSEYTGFTKDETHEVLARKFLTYEKKSPRTGKTGVFIKSTTDLTTSEFMDYLLKCREFGDEYDLNIPEPNEEDFSESLKK